jgi:hypothetical protein
MALARSPHRGLLLTRCDVRYAEFDDRPVFMSR